MNDLELEAQLRKRLQAVDLPAAPTALREMLADMPELPTGRGGRGVGGIVLLAAAILVLGGLGAAGALQRPNPTVAPPSPPSASVVDAPPTGPAVPAGFDTFEAPGIAFTHPASWVPTIFDYQKIFGTRYVGTFTRGLSLCRVSTSAGLAPTNPPGCVDEAKEPGTLIVHVLEYVRQLPGAFDLAEARTDYAGNPAKSPGPWEGSNPAILTWFVAGPDNSIYVVWAQAPSTEIESVRQEIDGALGTLRLSSWQSPPAAINGLIHVDTGVGFAFDYPAGWIIYYPNDMSMMDSAVVTVASGPLDPPCKGDNCQRFSTPPGTAVVEFRIGSGLHQPDWSRADSEVGGQPAFTRHWDGPMATSADEGDQWDVRLDDERRVLGIYSSLTRPGIDDQREIVDRIIDSVRIDAPAR